MNPIRDSVQFLGNHRAVALAYAYRVNCRRAEERNG